MKSLTYQPQGSRVASIHNGSSLFTGDAGSGESNIRRYLIENNLVDAIIQLPNNIFYNTGITTYVWLLTNKKRDHKVQLIDASRAFEKLRKNLGNRNCTITSAYADDILRIYMNREEREADNEVKVGSKLFDSDDFRYYSVQIERPLRLRCRFSALKCDELLYDAANLDLSQWLYSTYGEKVFSGLAAHVADIKEHLDEEDIKLTKKKLDALLGDRKWQERRELKEAAEQLMHAVGTDEYMDYNLFREKAAEAVKQLRMKLTAAQLKTILRSMSTQDAEAKPVIAKELKIKEIDAFAKLYGVSRSDMAHYGIFSDELTGEFFTYEPDTDLRDTEKIPVKDDILQYYLREVRPYTEEAWINLPVTKIGCEISFNKYFYRPVPLRSLEENSQDILALDSESKGFIDQLLQLL